MRFIGVAFSTIVGTVVLIAGGGTQDNSDLLKARDRQDRSALEKLAAQSRAATSSQPKDPSNFYRWALAESYSAEVAIEQHDKVATKNAAQVGVDAAQKAVDLKPDSAEYQRMLGTLCGQMVSSNSFSGLRYGKCALEAVNKAIQLDPKNSMAYVSHGVGNYYLPTAFGGGVDLAIKDFKKAISLDPKNADAWVWLGVALRKSNQPGEARKAFAKSLEIDPNRVWAKQQLNKTPAH